ncbi:MAG: sulfotransferase [Rhodothalassiaceae bacterium]
MVDQKGQTGSSARRIEPIPNFFIVGAPKCATTAMDAYLAAHPDIYMAPYKEMHLFARDLKPDPDGRLAARYRSAFEAVADEAVVGESSVFYMLSEVAAREIAAFQPRAKILIMLRDPIDVIASHHSQIVYEGHESEKDIARALSLEAKRRASHRGRALTIAEKVLHYRDVVRFAAQIERFLAHFPREQVHIVLYDDVRRDLPAAYEGILRFLGVDPAFRPDFEVRNANKVVRSRAMRRFLRQTPEWFTRTARFLLPRRHVRHRLRARLEQLNARFTERRPPSPELRAGLANELRSEVERLERLRDRDLSHWCRSEPIPDHTQQPR